jgi:hypothetical protein
MKYSLVSCCFILGPNILPSTLLRRPAPMLFLQCETPSFTHSTNCMCMYVGILSESESVMQYVLAGDPCDMTCQYLYQLSSYLYCSAHDGSTPLTHILVHGHVIPIVHVTRGHLQSIKINHSVVPCLLTGRAPDYVLVGSMNVIKARTSKPSTIQTPFVGT